jgi:hypothetical protein
MHTKQYIDEVSLNTSLNHIVRMSHKSLPKKLFEQMFFSSIDLVNSSYHFHPTTTDILMPMHFQVMNNTLWNLCPSGI